MISTAINKGVEAALQGCREAQVNKQLEILELGLRGLRADQKKFSHIPDIRDQIGQTIKAVEQAINSLNIDTLPEIYLEENIDVEERHAGETPLEFRIKQALNKAYKEEYAPLIKTFTDEREEVLSALKFERDAAIQKAEADHRSKLRTINITDITEESEVAIEKLDSELNLELSAINLKYDNMEKEAIQSLKATHKQVIEDAKSTYHQKLMPLVKQLQIEIASKHFNASIQSLKKVFNEDKVEGLSIDVNSLTFYAFLSQTLDKLGKLDIISSIGLPFIDRMVKDQIPESDRQVTSLSDKIAASLANQAGQAAGELMGKIVDGPLANLKKAVEYSESMSVLEVGGIETPFMGYYESEKRIPDIGEQPQQAPTNFFQAIENVSKADGVLDTLGALRGFYTAITSGSADGCLDDTENMFDGMNQGLRCELMRQRFKILSHTQAALKGFNDLPADWRSFQDELDDIMESKLQIDNNFVMLNNKYVEFKNQFDLIKKQYDQVSEKLASEREKNPNSEYVELENKKARTLIKEGDKISQKLNKQFESALKEEILKAKRSQYEKLFGAWNQKTTRDKKIIKYFLTNSDPALEMTIQSIQKRHQEKIQKLSKKEILVVADRLDKEYKSKIDSALQKVGALQTLEAQRQSFRQEMADCSRAFYIESQKFKVQHDAFNKQVSGSLDHLEALSIPDDNFHLWQLKNLALWSSDELAPLDVVVKLFDTLGDKIKASAVKYSDIFELAAAEKPPERKMKAEIARGSEASLSDRVKQSTGNMLGSSIVELKAGEQMGYLSVFAQNIASTIATEHKVNEIRSALAESNMVAKHAVLTHEATPVSPEAKSRLSQLFERMAEFFRKLNPFGGNASEMQATQTVKPAVLAAYSSDTAKTSKSRDRDGLKKTIHAENKTHVEIKTKAEKGRTKK